MARRSLNTTELMHPGSLPMLGIRIIQFILAVAALGVTGSLVSSVKSYFYFLEFDEDLNNSHNCNVPGRFSYNIFCAVITILALIYLAVSAKLLLHIPLVKYSHLAIDATLFIFWLAAAATASTVYLEDLCGICGYSYYYDFFDLSGAYDFTCCCVSSDTCCDSPYVFWKRQLLGKRASGRVSSTKNTQSSSAKEGKRAGLAGNKWAARKGLDAVLCILFFITLAIVAYFVWSARRAASNTGPAAPRTDAKVAEPTKDAIAMEHQTQPVPAAPAPQYSAQQPQHGIHQDPAGFQQPGGPQYSAQQPQDGIHQDAAGLQQTGASFDQAHDPYQTMQPEFEQHHPGQGDAGLRKDTYAGV